MSYSKISMDEIPAFDIIKNKLDQIGTQISALEGFNDFDSGSYKLRLHSGDNGRTADVVFTEEFLEDLRDNSSPPNSKYTLGLNDRLNQTLLAEIELQGLVSFNETSLKYLLLKYFYSSIKQGHAEKYNTIGRYDSGDFESYLRITLTAEEKQLLAWGWDELKRQRLIAPSGKDMLNPDDWCLITKKGIAAIENKSYTDFPDEAYFFDKGEVFTAYRKIKSIMSLAKQELLLVDNYMSEEVLDLINTINPEVRVKIITDNCIGNFSNAYKKIKKERGNIEVRKSNHFHDRYIFLDNIACYQIGGSIKDAGNKAMTLDKKAEMVAIEVLKTAAEVWNSAKEITT